MRPDSVFNQLLLLSAGILPAYVVRFKILGVPTNILEVVIISLVILGFFSSGVRKLWLASWRAMPKSFAVLVVLFILSCVLSVVISPHLQTSLGILKSWVLLPIVYGWLVFAANAAQKRKIIDHLILSGAAVSLLGISQIGQMSRISSLYDVPNSLALFVAPLAVLATWRGLDNRRQLLFGIVMFSALLLSGSLAGLIAFFAALLIGLLLYKGKYVLTTKPLLVVAALLLVSLPYTAKKISYLIEPNSSAYVRLQLWSVSWELIRQHPISGIGLGTFEPAYQQVLHKRFIQSETLSTSQPLPEFVFRDPHNWLLSFWLNTGIVGLLCFSALNAQALTRAYKRSYAGRTKQAVMLAVISILIFGMTDTIYWKNDLAVMFYILLVIILDDRDRDWNAH